MEPTKEEEKPLGNEGIEEEEEEEEEEMTGKNKANLNEKLISSVKKNEYEEVEKCLKKKADINYEENNKKKWNALTWACCNGNTEIVKLLLSKKAGLQYLEVRPENRHVPVGSTREMRPNPLHWASFKNHVEVVELLLKTGFHWQDVDGSGNNSVMLAAAGSAVEVFKSYLQFGVSLEEKNSRGHTVKDLTTEPTILKLVEKHERAKECQVSKQPFRENEIKYWCWVSDSFVNAANFRMEWVFRTLQSAEKEKIDGRSKACWQQSENIRQKLKEAIRVYDEANLKEVLRTFEAKHNQLEITFLEECLRISHKLSVQNKILAYIQSLSKVSDYKIILKSVNNIKKMLKDSEPIGIDKAVTEKASAEIDRLNAERNLRFESENMGDSLATRPKVKRLEEVYDDAEQKGVASEYLEIAEEIKSKMKKCILVQDITEEFEKYPERPDPYPEPLVIDFKTKKPLDPETKKPTDPANLLPKKKKGKKANVFAIPEWATELKDMNDKIKEVEDLLAIREELDLPKNVCSQAEESIVRMKKESRYRKDMGVLQGMVDEQTKKKK